MERRRGVGGEGAWRPCHREETRESGKERTPKRLWFIRENPCSSVAKKHPASVLIRGSAQQLPGGLHPSPPAPLPCQGRGVPCALSNATQKHKFLPSPPERGRGVGGEGAWRPCHRKETRESGKERTPKNLWFIRENPCSSVAKKLPASVLIRGSAQQLSGGFTPPAASLQIGDQPRQKNTAATPPAARSRVAFRSAKRAHS